MIREILYFSSNDNWIIGAIARETISESQKSITTTKYPNSRVELVNPSNFFQSKIRSKYADVLFLGATMFFTIIESRRNPIFQNCRLFITHMTIEQPPNATQIRFLNQLVKIFTMNSLSAEILYGAGVTTEIVVVFGAINKKIFYPAPIKRDIKPFVLISGQAAPRKRPELILKFIKDSPEIDFVIHGKFWEGYETQLLRNLTIKQFNYLLQPVLMRNASVLLTMSDLEGGPFSILEALASGTPVISTVTGFAPDLINSGNGQLLEDPFNFPEIRRMIKYCMSLKKEFSSRNLLPLDLSWKILSEYFFD